MSETTYVHDGDVIDHVAGSDLKAGEVVFVDAICGQIVTDVASGQTGALRIEGVIRVPKASATVLAGGADVHWDDTAELAVAAAADGVMGAAVGGGANGQTYVDVKLNA